MLATTIHRGVTRWFCACVLKTGENVFLVARTETEAEASEVVHNGYEVDYVLDILTPFQMDRVRYNLRAQPAMMTASNLN